MKQDSETLKPQGQIWTWQDWCLRNSIEHFTDPNKYVKWPWALLKEPFFSLLVEERDDYMPCILFDIWKLCFIAGQKEEMIPTKIK